MTLQNETGAPTITYNMDYLGALSTNTIINGSGHKLAFVGQVWHPTVKTGTINIRKVRFRCGACTFNFAGGTEVRVSLQDLSATAGPPYQPDGSQDQTYDFKTATTTITQNAMNATGNLSADRAIDLSADSLGDANSRWIAIVFEFNAFQASDSMIVNGFTYAASTRGGMGGLVLLNTAGTWAIVSQRLNNVILECDDGTFAFLLPSMVLSAAPATSSVASNGAIRRAGLKFKFPTARKIDRASLVLTIPNGCDGRLVLYDSDGNTELVSVDIDNDSVSTATGWMEVAFPPVTLLANTFYRFVFVAGTTTAGSLSYFDVAAAGHLDGMYIGQNAHSTTYDGASWTDTTTRQPFFGLGISATDDGLSASAGHIASRQLTGM